MNNIIDILNNLSSLLTIATDLLPKIVAFASVLAAFLPPAGDGSAFAKVHGVINLLAFNFKHAENKEP